MRRVRALLASGLLLSTIIAPPLLLAETTGGCVRVQDILQRVEAIRGQRSLKPLACESLDSDQLRARLESMQHSAVSRAALENFEAVFKAVGFIPPNYPYARCEKEGAADWIWAVYDRRNRKILLRSDVEAPDSIIAHEIVHALQDQRYPLQNLQARVNSFDQDLALAALIEGDAVRIEEHFASNPGSGLSGGATVVDSTCAPPAALLNLKLFPYEWGSRFISLEQENLQYAFASPPQTSAQILYPKQKPSPSSAPHPAKKRLLGYVLIAEDSLGEFFLRNLLKTYLDPKQAILAAKGWRADRIALYRNSAGHSAVRWELHFESSRDVDQLRLALADYAHRRLDIRIEPSARRWQAKTSEGFSLSAVLAETSVTLLFGNT